MVNDVSEVGGAFWDCAGDLSAFRPGSDTYAPPIGGGKPGNLGCRGCRLIPFNPFPKSVDRFSVFCCRKDTESHQNSGWAGLSDRGSWAGVGGPGPKRDDPGCAILFA